MHASSHVLPLHQQENVFASNFHITVHLKDICSIYFCVEVSVLLTSCLVTKTTV